MASVRSVMTSVSVPLGIKDPIQPNIASTLWRTVADLKRRVFLFDSALSPTSFWVVLGDLDLKEGAPARRLPLVNGQTYSGNAAAEFKPAEAFKFLEGKPTARRR